LGLEPPGSGVRPVSAGPAPGPARPLCGPAPAPLSPLRRAMAAPTASAGAHSLHRRQGLGSESMLGALSLEGARRAQKASGDAARVHLGGAAGGAAAPQFGTPGQGVRTSHKAGGKCSGKASLASQVLFDALSLEVVGRRRPTRRETGLVAPKPSPEASAAPADGGVSSLRAMLEQFKPLHHEHSSTCTLESHAVAGED